MSWHNNIYVCTETRFQSFFFCSVLSFLTNSCKKYLISRRCRRTNYAVQTFEGSMWCICETVTLVCTFTGALWSSKCLHVCKPPCRTAKYRGVLPTCKNTNKQTTNVSRNHPLKPCAIVGISCSILLGGLSFFPLQILSSDRGCAWRITLWLKQQSRNECVLIKWPITYAAIILGITLVPTFTLKSSSKTRNKDLLMVRNNSTSEQVGYRNT